MVRWPSLGRRSAVGGAREVSDGMLQQFCEILLQERLAAEEREALQSWARFGAFDRWNPHCPALNLTTMCSGTDAPSFSFAAI